MERLWKSVEDLLRDAVEKRVFPGCAAGILIEDHEWCTAVGRFTYDTGSTPVRTDSVYDVASVTKSIPVALIAHHCLERQKMKHTDPLTLYLTEYKGDYRERITIQHLLAHTLDFGFRLSECRNDEPETLIRRILSAPLRSAPGTSYAYANATSIILGMVLERVTGMPLDIAADTLVFEPLGMKRTTFHPERFPWEEVAPTEYDSWRGRLIQAEVHDESAARLRPLIVGSAGLFSTVPDFMKCICMLLNNGIAGGRQLFKPATVRLMYANACPPSLGERSGYGWELDRKEFMGALCRKTTFGKTGFTGCSVVADPERRRAVVLLSNHVHPRRRENREMINRVRSSLADLVLGHRVREQE
jgi:CubicO group peptidase (beta-lactamase class C family)